MIAGQPLLLCELGDEHPALGLGVLRCSSGTQPWQLPPFRQFGLDKFSQLEAELQVIVRPFEVYVVNLSGLLDADTDASGRWGSENGDWVYWRTRRRDDLEWRGHVHEIVLRVL